MKIQIAFPCFTPRTVSSSLWRIASLACAISLAALSLSLTAQPNLGAIVGDAPQNPGPLAHLSGTTAPASIKTAMRKVANWQLSRTGGDFSQDWTFATLYLGMLEASATLHDPRYSNYVLGVANHYKFHLGPRKFHADDQAIGQSYLWLYTHDHNRAEIAPLQAQFDEVMQTPDDPQKPIWWWCDALFMAPPVWTQLAATTHEAKYLSYMDREWHVTSDLLWDPQEHLFFRDKSYFDKREANGAKIFWSRGNGWVMDGLVRVLTFMPQDDPHRPFYVDKFRQMAAKIRSIQSKDGLWRPGLLDAEHYPYPEVSGSAFFVYALAWGVNQGILDRAVYGSTVERGWRGLVSHIYKDGRLGCIQPIGAAPGAYTPSASYVFGVGAFLLAGSEVIHLHDRGANPHVTTAHTGVHP
ncbi:MAG TPA: glycoside hydrolase family 88 protein [Terracidiphilus sp.]|nr:glycoside hydrolase family 88 protein [Terracidiphilus sp.]